MTNTRSASSVCLPEVSVDVLVVVGGRGCSGGLSARCRSALSQQRSDRRRPV